MTFAVTKVGLLGESLSPTVGVHTVYTVSSGSTAMVNLMWEYDPSASSGFHVYVGSALIHEEDTAKNLASITGTPQQSGPLMGIGVWKSYDPTNPKVLGGDASALVTNSVMMLPLNNDFGLGSEESVRYEVLNGVANAVVFRVQGKEFST